jgi:hypothetical protein
MLQLTGDIEKNLQALRDMKEQQIKRDLSTIYAAIDRLVVCKIRQLGRYDLVAQIDAGLLTPPEAVRIIEQRQYWQVQP